MQSGGKPSGKVGRGRGLTTPASSQWPMAVSYTHLLESLRQAAEKGARLAVLPELCLTGYTCGDLFLQQPLLEGAEAALAFLMKESRDLPLIALAGLPVRAGGKLYNCAAVFCAGQLLGR